MAVAEPSIISTGIVRNQTLLNDCISVFYLGTLALDTPHVSLWLWKIVLLSAQCLHKLAHWPFIGGGKLNHQHNERRERYGVIVDDFYFRDNNVG